MWGALCGANANQQQNTGIVYLLEDQFTTVDNAPVTSPRTCEPGPGTLTFVELDGTLAIASGALAFTAQATAAWNDNELSFTGPLQTRTAGITLLDTFTLTGGTGNKDVDIIGWYSAANAKRANSQGQLIHYNGTLTSFGTVGVCSAGVAYQYALVLRGTGMFMLVNGGVYTDWTLLWVHNAGTGNVYPGFNNFLAAGTLDNVRILNLADYDARFATDNGLATDVLTSPAVNAAGVHIADCLIEFSGLVPSADATQIIYRRTNDTTGWRVDVNTDGNVYLQELNAGTTQRGSAAHSIADGAAYRVMVIAAGNVHRVWVNNALKITYTDAGNLNLTATSMKVLAKGTDDTLTSLISWPRIVTGFTT